MVKIPKHLSLAMLKGLRLAKDGGLFYFIGGFWISGNSIVRPNERGVPILAGTGERAEFIKTVTVQALERRQFIVAISESASVGWSCRRILTEFGQEVLEAFS